VVPRPPTELGLYTIPEAGRLARTNRSTVASWVRAGVGAEPLYDVAGQSTLLTFDDLISLLVVRELRKAEVPMLTVKRIEAQLAQLWHVKRPFASGHFSTRYGAVVTSVDDVVHPVAVTGAVQEIFYELIKNDLRDVSYDAELRARSWRPTAYVLIRPDLQFGAPCVEGTRVTTRTIREYLDAGESIEELAHEFHLTSEQIAAVSQWEKSLAAAA
jgi:uncharacterized protein (DUF433 family)